MEAAKQFGEFMRTQRRAKKLGLDDIAHTTRIPERSLRYLEDGELDKLPADVFVRGFIRAYAGMVGIDGDDAVRRYAACGKTPAPVSLVSRDEATRVIAAAVIPGTESDPAAPIVVAEPSDRSARSFIPAMLRAEQPSRRGPITLAVIILVIVATLTMSYLLRRPSYSGDGVTRAPAGQVDPLA